LSLRQLGRRGAQSLIVLLGVSFVSFLLIHLVPGDPVRIALGPKAPEQQVVAVRHQLGLDQSLFQQYVHYVGNALRGDFGYSIQARVPVSSLVLPRIGPSLLLLGYATAISILLATPLAIVSALRRNRASDHLIRLLSMVTFAMPAFWLGLVLVQLFSLHWSIFPVSGYSGDFGTRLVDLALPALTIGLYLAPLLVRTLRSSLIEVLSSDYIEAARARGLSGSRVVGRHALRNASMATITVLAVNLGFLISGTVIVEVVFAIPGLGSLIVSAVQTRDFPTVQALTLIFGGIVIAINFLTDVVHVAVDPRIRTAR
jgi:peptide/nickel transport system permease protein